MSRATVVLRNIAANWLGFAVNAAITLLLTPFVLHNLGTARYGIWILTASFIGYYGILDLGFRAGVTQHLTQYLAVKDYERASETLSTAVQAFIGFAFLLVALSLIAAFNVPRWFEIPTEAGNEAFWCVLIVGLGAAAQYALCPFASIFSAAQRFDLASYIGVGTRLVNALGIYLTLRAGHGLIGVSAVTAGTTLLDYLIRWRVALRIVPQLRVARRLAGLARLREVFSFGIWNFLITINRYAYQHLPNILIAAIMPIAAVGHYALATGLVIQIGAMLAPIGQVLYPAATAMHAQNDHAGVARLYHDGSRLVMLAMVPVALIAGIYAEDFYRLWIGPQFLSGAPFPSVALLLQILLLSIATAFISNVGSQILVGAGLVRLVAVALISGSAISAGVALALIPAYGLLGVAAGTVAASVIIDLIVIPWLVQRRMKLSVTDFLRQAAVRPALVCLLDVAALLAIRMTGRPASWLHLICYGIASVSACAAITLAVGMTAAERQRFLLRPLRNFVARPG